MAEESENELASGDWWEGENTRARGWWKAKNEISFSRLPVFPRVPLVLIYFEKFSSVVISKQLGTRQVLPLSSGTQGQIIGKGRRFQGWKRQINVTGWDGTRYHRSPARSPRMEVLVVEESEVLRASSVGVTCGSISQVDLGERKRKTLWTLAFRRVNHQAFTFTLAGSPPPPPPPSPKGK